MSIDIEDLIKRWQRAGVRAQEEKVRVIELNGEFRATSSSQPLESYRLWPSEYGWACECQANQEHHVPCKHLAALADLIGLDLLADTRTTATVPEAGDLAQSQRVKAP